MVKFFYLKKVLSKRIYIIVFWLDVIELFYILVEVIFFYSAVFNVFLFVFYVIFYLSYSLKLFFYCYLRDVKILNNIYLNNYIFLVINDKINILSLCILFVLIL